MTQTAKHDPKKVAIGCLILAACGVSATLVLLAVIGLFLPDKPKGSAAPVRDATSSPSMEAARKLLPAVPLPAAAAQPPASPSSETRPPDKPAAPPAAHIDEAEAWVMAKGFVTSALRSPSTADFGGIFDQGPNCRSAGAVWKCVGWVDAQNGFGATVRNNFSVTIKYTEGIWADPQSWQVIDGPHVGN